MSCLGECWDLGPPPDSILFMPPPPAPSALFQQRLQDNASAAPCSAPLCAADWEPPRGDYVELSRQDVGTADDTWPLVLVAASVGVLVLGALLALFLLRCRDQHAKEQHRVSKAVVPSADTASDARAVCWAALTPRGGTQHFVSVDEEENHHYETVDGPWYRPNTYDYEHCNEGVDYEEPNTAAAWSYHHQQQQQPLQQQDMRCISSLRRPRPRVSPPTRIEHPNLPPLNLNPLPVPPSRGSTLSRRPSHSDTANTILKYNIN